MAKKTQKLVPLTLQDIILRGDAETIRQALEARVQIDTLLEEREAAYRRISELEEQVEGIVGEEGVFPFPEPPVPVAQFDVKAAPKKKPAPKPSEKKVVASESPAPAEASAEEAAPEADVPAAESADESKDD
ncbi:hypothetical protein [Coraliomargarita parva]|uniref:hypothetical protein n=1 Tax=Coraliomargarita parva TaxID=3014050 RepID=UPI0022B4B00B|nr:hypothetical protein [Coraliomargarita parva]